MWLSSLLFHYCKRWFWLPDSIQVYGSRQNHWKEGLQDRHQCPWFKRPLVIWSNANQETICQVQSKVTFATCQSLSYHKCSDRPKRQWSKSKHQHHVDFQYQLASPETLLSKLGMWCLWFCVYWLFTTSHWNILHSNWRDQSWDKGQSRRRSSPSSWNHFLFATSGWLIQRGNC